MNATQQIHLLEARQAYRESKEFGPATQGCGIDDGKTVQVVTERLGLGIDEVTCKACKHWYWHVEGIFAAPHVLEEVAAWQRQP